MGIRKGSHFCLTSRKYKCSPFQRKREMDLLADWLYKNPKGFPFLFAKPQIWTFPFQKEMRDGFKNMKKQTKSTRNGCF